MVKLSLLFAFLLLFNSSFGQCPSGSIGVTGAGCGCASGCDLTAVGGPDCGSGVSGNCNAGYVPMVLDIPVPGGCEFTVQAQMELRTGCSASGADGNCSTCDALKVDVIAGVKPMQFGASNSSLSDSYTLIGPGTIRISGSANRSDEIITYQVTSTGATCFDCSSTLPIELAHFSAERMDKYVQLTWGTESEVNNNYFTIEQSLNGHDFSPIGYVNGAGNSAKPIAYKLIDNSPEMEVVSYYRLKQTDYDGAFSYADISAVPPFKRAKVIGYFNAMGQEVKSQTKGLLIIRYEDGSSIKIVQ